MGDDLAKQLFDAFWDPLVARGWPRPCAWNELHETQRAAWEGVATEARRELGLRYRRDMRAAVEELGAEQAIANLLEANATAS
jgi:hypothetical protein